VTVIGYHMWKDRVHADPAVIGKTQMLNGMPHVIVGVALEGFYGTFVGWAMQFWVPVSMQERFDATGYKLEDRGAQWIEGFVRLKPLREEEEKRTARKDAEEQRGYIVGGLVVMAVGLGLGVMLAVGNGGGVWTVGLLPFLIGCVLLAAGLMAHRRTGKPRS
jgi:hypothetical protein